MLVFVIEKFVSRGYGVLGLVGFGGFNDLLGFFFFYRYVGGWD